MCNQPFRRRPILAALFVLLFVLPTAAQTQKPRLLLRPQLEGPARTPTPRTFDALHYALRTRFDRKTKTVFGDETLTLKPLAANFREIRLDAAGLTFESVTLDDGSALKWRQEKPDQLVIALPRAFGAGETVSVRLVYKAVNPKRGLYFTPEATLPGTKIRRPPQIWTQGEPEDNRFWLAAHDFPDDLATTEQFITVTAPGEIAIGNGKLLETIDNPDGTRTFHWQMEQPHAVYLVSLVVGEFVKLDDVAALPPLTPDGPELAVPLEYYTYPGAEKQALAAYSRTPEMMREFTRKIGVQFPFARYAQTGVAFYDQFSGMENITSTTLADTSALPSALFRANNPTAELPGFARRELDNLLSHELAHSWFGNLVTCRDWSHLWLNEGLATFMEAVWQEKLSGREGYLREMRANQTFFMAEDLFRYRRPLVHNRYRDPVQLFDSTTYKKGGFVIHMLRQQVGDETFWRALNLYLTARARQNVTTPDLQRAFEEASGQKLDWFFRQWVYQAGYPELRVRYRFNAATKRLSLTVAQTQKPDAMTPAVFQLPGVQVEITTPAGLRSETVNITQRTQTFDIPLEKAPTRVYFDADERVLKDLDYPQQPGGDSSSVR
jgi:aminopeptidase N